MDPIQQVLVRRQHYWANGFRPIEVWSPDAKVNDAGKPLKSPGKQPRGLWRKAAQRTPPDAVTKRPFSSAINTGISCEDDVVGVDVDVPVQELADQIVALAESKLGVTPLVRIGNAPKTLLVFRPEAPFAKIQTVELFLPDGVKCKVEILANGQQFVADGIHPDTGKPYFWTAETPETVTRSDLPAITEEMACEFKAEAEALLRSAGAKEKIKEKPPNGHDPKPLPRQPLSGGSAFFRDVNSAALADIMAWAPTLFPGGHHEVNTGAWRVSSAALGRELEEDISIHRDGIRDFGEEEPRSAIDLVTAYGGKRKPLDAALWLCERLRIDPKSLGYQKVVPQPPADPYSADWPEPADLLSPAPVPRFPADFLPGDLGKFAESQAFDLQAPLDFVAIPLLIAAATAIGKDFRMAPKAHAPWDERACLWGACIGAVGTIKTPAFNAALAPIWPLQKKWREAFQEEFKAYSAASIRARIIKKQWEKDAAAALRKGEEMVPMPEGAEPPEPPTAREMITIDATQERIAALMMNNPRGMLLFRDELSGWFSSFNQYRAGADEQFYLQCHAGGAPWLQRRVKGDVTIPDPFLAVFGGLQPDVVAAVLARGHEGKPDNGLTARFSLLAWPEPVADLQWVDNSPDRDLRERVNSLFEKLADLDPERFVGPRFLNSGDYPPLRFTPEAQDIFHDWHIGHHQAQQDLEPEAQIKGHFAKYDGLFARLALVHHLLRYAQGEPVEPATVDAGTARAVRRFIDGYLRPHARKVYGHLGRDPGYAGARKIGQWLIANPDRDRFTARDISRKHWSGLTGKNENTGKNYLRAALDHLDNVAGWVRAEDVPERPQGGRPTTLYIVNPKIRR